MAHAAELGDDDSWVISGPCATDPGNCPDGRRRSTRASLSRNAALYVLGRRSRPSRPRNHAVHADPTDSAGLKVLHFVTPTGCPLRGSHGFPTPLRHSATRAPLRRIEGPVRGVSGISQAYAYCNDALIQWTAWLPLDRLAAVGPPGCGWTVWLPLDHLKRTLRRSNRKSAVQAQERGPSTRSAFGGPALIYHTLKHDEPVNNAC